ncbi:TRAP dicarboxylate transporter, DctM subunit (plasmid) [Phaeobacter inhibens]|jgi:tripartite ATP-independent transporter DctM subunit|uniref:TRAP transporter large permease protein n=3 Tax=Rhodobacterales TaxID=204455 RepID=A0ABZ0HMM6_TRISK|nr:MULTISPECIES: TRAP transporter large permease [Rhodobacterales]AUQ52428.1 TRAP dicarboxylate transporter, DctM subunit [Phaeobacter inhibens]AUQ97033.1 TRAP dicarboxylate transporter, DctM subunit [Phaeobacter inhibens]AUR22233.1 TRAP dicarboxylate transporter, DctM subunit [Phaeobacter inhibens]MBQ4827219.1 TRAP transporter large permease [Leisingera sp. HS039]MCF6430341.1 TRAP transporter large permease [Leisingera sp. MMG026]
MILIVTFSLLLLFIFLAIPVGAALGLLGVVLDESFSIMPLRRAIGDMMWENSIEFLLVAVPMFVMLGEIMLRSDIAEKMYDAMAKWLSWLPGGLMHSNIGSSAIFAATSGSSVATAATVGTVAVPQIDKRGYHTPLFLGSLAAGGTLGILIPPSVGLIIYGLLTNTSVPKLYLAGILPGLVLAGLYSLTIVLLCLANKGWGGEKISISWSERFASLPNLLQPLFIFIVVIGSIYAGWATPTESASLGVLAALLLSWKNGKLTRDMLLKSFEGTMRTTAMIMLIILAAAFLNFVLAVIGLAAAFQSFIEGLGLSPFQVLLIIIAIYLVMGCFMESLSMLITTTPIVVPVIVALGYDPIWFGVVLMLLLETALITPPIGLNLYVVQSIRQSGPIKDVIKGAIPFVFAMFVMIGLVIAFPSMALWLPSLL